jgi:outer membrane immunogenic protein
MKKLVLALTAMAAFTGSAMAADLPARYAKAPAIVAPAYNWTGFYIFGGGGGGLWSANGGVDDTVTGTCIICTNTRTGGDGWFGTVGAGYDWQASSWVIGIFGDGTFGSLKGNIGDALVGPGIVGTVKMQEAWAAGGRIGYLVAPNVLSYVNAGYTGTYWSGSNLLFSTTGTASGLHTEKFDTGGAFIGGGVENNLDIFGINAPGWFMKTEYRAAYLDNKRLSERLDGTNLQNGRDITFKPFVQTISTSLVYRFNWGGAPIAARY